MVNVFIYISFNNKKIFEKAIQRGLSHWKWITNKFSILILGWVEVKRAHKGKKNGKTPLFIIKQE